MKLKKDFKKGLAKKATAITLSLSMMAGLLPGDFANAVDVKAVQVPTLASLSKQVAEEGTVLLKNDNNVLPLAGKTVSVFGRTQNDTQWTGYGSGGYVTSSYTTDVIDYLRRDSSIELNEDLAKRYADWVAEHPGYTGNDWREAEHNNAEMPLEEAWVEEAAQESEVAVVIIGRRWGEGRDLRMGTEDGSYYLTSEEKEMLSLVNKHFKDIAVVFNTGSVMDMEWVANNTYENIDAYVYGWQGGTEAGRSIAEILTGEVTPSGKLPVTIMESIEYDETNATYDTKYEPGVVEHVDRNKVYQNRDIIYQEDIYLGYRYTETFGDEHVLYPFGYGLSYTEFETEVHSVEVIPSEDGDIRKDVIAVDVTVTNWGDEYAGKEVVQVYYGAPQGRLGKAAKTLVAYAKTNLLQPGESQDITLKFTVDMMSSYDDGNYTGHDSAYVLEAGDYPIYVGNSVKAAREGAYTVNELTLVEQLEEAQAPTTAFDRVVAKEDGNGNLVPELEAVPTATRNLDERIINNLPEEIEYTGDKGIKLLDVYKGTKTIQEFVAQLSVDEVCRLCRGVGGMNDGQGIAGNASAFGGATDALKNYGIPAISTCDGPSGIRHSSGDGYSTVIPSGITLGSTWNDELIEKLCEALGEECIATTGAGNKGVDILLAPGMNIIRNPRCGRNYEYFSEDPLLTGRLAAAYVKGLQKVGVIADVKHYVAYNQGQGNVNSIVSERALREIYLKGFEIAIKESNPYTVMDSNGLINGEFAHSSYDLNTTFLRKEWGWDGMVMTDWGPPDFTYKGSRGDITEDAAFVQSQCDVSMPGHTNPGSVEASVKKDGGGITLAEAQRSAINVLNCILKSMKFARDNGLEFYPYEEPAYERFTVETTQAQDPRLSAIYLDGYEISNFDPLLLDYTVFTPDLTEVAEVTCDAPEGVTVKTTTEGNTTVIRATCKGAENIYKVTFTDAAGLPPMVKDPKYAYLSSLKVNDSEVAGFYPTLYNYEVYVDGDPEEAEITHEAAEDVEVTWNYDADTNTIIVRSVSDHQAIEYKLKCADAPIDTGDIPDPFVIGEVNEEHSNRFYLADQAYYMYNLQTENSKNEEAGHKNLSHIATDSYALYQVEVERGGYYNIDSRFASETAITAFDQFNYGIEVDGVPAAQWSKLGGTGGWQVWETLTASRIYLPEGSHKLKLFFITDGLNLSWMEFERIPDATIAKENFEALEQKVPTLNKDLYTTESWDRVQAAYDAAKEASADDTMDGTVFLEIVTELENAVAGLVEKAPVQEPVPTPTPEPTPTPDPTPTPTPTPNPGEGSGSQPGDNDTKPEDVKVTGIKITGMSKNIAAGKKVTLSAAVTPANATNKSVKWSSSNTKWATVNANGKVSVKKAGKNKTVTITATATDGSGKKATYKIKIMPNAVKKITVKASGKTLKNNATVKAKAGKTVKLRATVSPSKKVNKTLKWTSSNTKWATVDKKGNVKTKKAGKGKTVKITAQATDGSNKKITIKVKIVK